MLGVNLESLTPYLAWGFTDIILSNPHKNSGEETPDRYLHKGHTQLRSSGAGLVPASFFSTFCLYMKDLPFSLQPD